MTPLYQMCAAMATAFGAKNVYFQVLTPTTNTTAVSQTITPFVNQLDPNEWNTFDPHEMSKAIAAGAAFSLQMPFTLASLVYFDEKGDVVGGLLRRDEGDEFVPASEELSTN